MEAVILGPPGSGKSTQSRHLSEEYNIKHVNTGEILRNNEDRLTGAGKIREIMDRGDLVPKPIVNELVMNVIEETENYVLDGFPRTRSQAELLVNSQDVDIIIHLEVPLKLAKERVLNRLICRNCNCIYNATTNPPTHENRCDRCGDVLKQRNDDNRESTINRIENYAYQTEEVIQYFSRSENYTSINAEQNIESVFQKICDVIDEAMTG